MNQQAKTVLQKADVDKIPSLPHILLPLLDICHDDNLSFVELAAILKQDPGLYTQFYSVCHQHMCDLSQNALPTARDSADSTLEEMLRLLGINTIKSTTVTVYCRTGHCTGAKNIVVTDIQLTIIRPCA
jgi:hypothetical protein